MPHGGKGRSAKERGCIPHHPVILVPGYMSSCLTVEESPWKDWSDRRIWLSMQAMGFEKVFTDAFPVLKKYSEGRKAEVKNKERKKATSTHDIELSEKRKWITHMVLDSDGVSDPEGIRVRPMKGLDAITYLDPGRITSELSYVFGPIVNALEDIGYTSNNLVGMPYDWRLPPHALEERDQYFSRFMQAIESAMYGNGEKKVVLVAHSLGNRVLQFFLRWLECKVGREWIDHHIESWIAIGPLWLGAPKAFRAMVSGEMMGLDSFIFQHEGIALSRTTASSCWMLPLSSSAYNVDSFGLVRRNRTSEAGVDSSPSSPPSSTSAAASGAEAVNFIEHASRLGYHPSTLEACLEHCKLNAQLRFWESYYLSNPYFGAYQEMKRAPPISKLFAVYGVNRKTEVCYFFKDEEEDGLTPMELDTDPRLTLPGHVVKDGIVYEVPSTPQKMLLGESTSGDGTVPYCSLYFCSVWKDEGVDVRIRELDNAEHRAILKDKRLIQLVTETVCMPPVKVLQDKFEVRSYDVVKHLRMGRTANRVLRLSLTHIENLRPFTTEPTSAYAYMDVENVSVEGGTRIVIVYRSKAHSYQYESKSAHEIASQIVSRCSVFAAAVTRPTAAPAHSSSPSTPLRANRDPIGVAHGEPKAELLADVRVGLESKPRRPMTCFFIPSQLTFIEPGRQRVASTCDDEVDLAPTERHTAPAGSLAIGVTDGSDATDDEVDRGQAFPKCKWRSSGDVSSEVRARRSELSSASPVLGRHLAAAGDGEASSMVEVPCAAHQPTKQRLAKSLGVETSGSWVGASAPASKDAQDAPPSLLKAPQPPDHS